MDTRQIKFNLDCSKFGNQISVKGIRQGDSNSVEFVIKLIDCCKTISLNSNSKAVLYGLKPDGTKLCNSCSIDKEGNLVYKLHTQDTTVVGNVEYQLVVSEVENKTVKVIASPSFTCVVEPRILYPTYTELTEQPDDWLTNYNNYYELVDGAFIKLAEETAPSWESDKYYLAEGVIESKDQVEILTYILSQLSQLPEKGNQADMFSNHTVAIDTEGKIIWFSDATSFANNAGYICTHIPDAYSKDFILILGKNVEKIDEPAFVSSKAKEVYTYSQEIKDSVTSLGAYGVLPELIESYDYTSALMKTLLDEKDVISQIADGSITTEKLADDYIKYSGSYDIETIDDLKTLTTFGLPSDECYDYDFTKSVIVKCNFKGELASEYGECEHIGILTCGGYAFLGHDVGADCYYKYLLLINPETGKILSYNYILNSIYDVTGEYANINDVWRFAQNTSIETYEQLDGVITTTTENNPHKLIQKIEFSSNFPEYDLVGDRCFIGFTGNFAGTNSTNLLLLSVEDGTMFTYTYGSGYLNKVYSETQSGIFWETFNRHGATLEAFQEYIEGDLDSCYKIGLWEFVLDGFNNNEVCSCFVFPVGQDLLFIDANNGSLYRYSFSTNTMEIISVGITEEQVAQIEQNKTDIENLNTTLGNIETALDSIIAIQEEILGGSEE